MLSALGASLIQVKATVLKVKPHARTTSNASGSMGQVAHRNRTQSFPASPVTGRALMSSNVIVG